jgi:diguanylate cyclase (GGDEF)-like protein
MLDLDQFKSFNDRYGHAAGDSALRSFGRLLSARLRATDVACRYGGEEFTLLLPNTPLEQAARIADRLREEAEATPIVHGGESYPPLTVSAGIAIYPEDGQTAQALLDAADAALYRAKSGGRNRIMPWVALPLAGPTVRRTLPSAG